MSEDPFWPPPLHDWKVPTRASTGGGEMKRYGLYRGGERRADVVELTSGKTVVAWPTSVVVYDSMRDARAVHIDHMGGRGEPTEFRPEDETREAAQVIQDANRACDAAEAAIVNGNLGNAQAILRDSKRRTGEWLERSDA